MARQSIIPVFVPHLGCPHSCVFCNQNRISGSLEPATEEDVKKALEGAPEDCQLAFYGGSFTAIPVEKQLELLRAGRGYTIRLSTRPDAIDNETLSRLEEYGVETIELGAQSMDARVLCLSGRGHGPEAVEKASLLIKERGFKLILQMMTGLPGDTKEKSLETARRIAALRPDGVRIYPTVIVKDTALYEMWKRGKYEEHSVEEATDWCSEILPIFEEAGIPVIRLGLNPTEELSGGAAVAGAYHPALGELVKSRIMRNQLEELVRSSGEKSLEIIVPKNRLSQAIGQHRCNLEYLKEKYALDELKIIGK